MKLETLNKYLNLFLIALVFEIDTEHVNPTRIYVRTIFSVGWVKYWPHIRLLDWMGL